MSKEIYEDFLRTCVDLARDRVGRGTEADTTILTLANADFYKEWIIDALMSVGGLRTSHWASYRREINKLINKIKEARAMRAKAPDSPLMAQHEPYLNNDSLISMLEAFVHDPLISWRLLGGVGRHGVLSHAAP